MRSCFVGGCLILAVACSSSSSQEGEPETPYAPAATEGGEEPSGAAADGAAPETFEAQVKLGGQLFGEKCAGCHGDAGQGKDAPPVVGLASGALPLQPPPGAKRRTTEFRTVADIAEFVVTNMPPKAPGSLTSEQYWAILAFDLKANGIELQQKLTPELAATLQVPRPQ